MASDGRDLVQLIYLCTQLHMPCHIYHRHYHYVALGEGDEALRGHGHSRNGLAHGTLSALRRTHHTHTHAHTHALATMRDLQYEVRSRLQHHNRRGGREQNAHQL